MNIRLGCTASVRNRLRELRARILDMVYAPVISRLSTEDYFSCRTRNDCLRAFVRARMGGRRQSAA